MLCAKKGMILGKRLNSEPWAVTIMCASKPLWVWRNILWQTQKLGDLAPNLQIRCTAFGFSNAEYTRTKSWILNFAFIVQKVIEKGLYHFDSNAKLGKYCHLPEPLSPHLLKKKKRKRIVITTFPTSWCCFRYQILENSYRFVKVQGSSLLAQ